MRKSRVKKQKASRSVARSSKPRKSKKNNIKINIQNTSSGVGSGGGGQPYYQPVQQQQDLSMLPGLFSTLTDKINSALQQPAPQQITRDVPAVASEMSTQTDRAPIEKQPFMSPSLKRAIHQKAFSLKEVNKKIGQEPTPMMDEEPISVEIPQSMKPKEPEVVHDELVPSMMQKRVVPSMQDRAKAAKRAFSEPNDFPDNQQLVVADKDQVPFKKLKKSKPKPLVQAIADKPEPVKLPEERSLVPYKEPELPLFGIGIKRGSSRIAQDYLSKIKVKKPVSRPNLEKKRRVSTNSM